MDGHVLSHTRAAASPRDGIQAGTVPAPDGRRVFVQTSSDAGATWAARRETTSSVKRPQWLGYATGPGHGVTIQHGTVVGRLLVAADHSELGTLRGVQQFTYGGQRRPGVGRNGVGLPPLSPARPV